METFVNSLGKLVVYDGKEYKYYNSEQEARLMGLYDNIGELPADADIAMRLTTKVLPNLRAAISELLEIELTWYANGIPQAVEQARKAKDAIALVKSDQVDEGQEVPYTEADATIAGLDVSAWENWDVVMRSLKNWMDSPSENGVPPALILAMRYVRKV